MQKCEMLSMAALRKRTGCSQTPKMLLNYFLRLERDQNIDILIKTRRNKSTSYRITIVRAKKFAPHLFEREAKDDRVYFAEVEQRFNDRISKEVVAVLYARRIPDTIDRVEKEVERLKQRVLELQAELRTRPKAVGL